MSSRTHAALRADPRRRWAILVALAAAVVLLGCGAGVIPVPNPTPSPCHAACPPPAEHLAGGHPTQTQWFSMIYFDPWTVDSGNSDNNQVTLAAATEFGNVYAVFAGQSVRNGTTAQQLLSSAVQSDLDPSQFAGVQDAGPILGAEIGYVSGAGERFTATVSQQNAPDVPVYLEFMAAVRGTTGIVFESLSPLDPNSPSTSGVPNNEFDQMVNGVTWR